MQVNNIFLPISEFKSNEFDLVLPLLSIPYITHILACQPFTQIQANFIFDFLNFLVILIHIAQREKREPFSFLQIPNSCFYTKKKEGKIKNKLILYILVLSALFFQMAATPSHSSSMNHSVTKSEVLLGKKNIPKSLPQVDKPVVQSADKKVLSLKQGEIAGEVILKGTNLDTIISFYLLLDGNPSKDWFGCELGPPSSSSRLLRIKALPNALISEKFQLRLVADNVEVDVPILILRIEVTSPEPEILFQPKIIQTDILTISGRVFTPVNITSDRLTISGRVFTPVNITSDRLTISGRVFTPVNITTQKLTISGITERGKGKKYE